MEKIIIVGSGIAAISAAESIRKHNKNIGILIISEEEYYPYIRMQLSKALSDNINIKSIYLKEENWFVENSIGFIKGQKVISIDSKSKFVETSEGLKIEYTKLILANGSSPFTPPIENVNINGVFTIRQFKDIENIKKYIKENSVENIAVIGGGLLGIEAAWSLVSSGQGLKLNIIQNSDRVLSKQVDKQGGDIIESVMNKNSIIVHKNANTKKILGENKVSGLRFEDGREIKAEMVIISAGVRSNKNIAEKCGINVNRGIIVNEYMETSIKDVYAAGDVAELNEKVLGLWPIADNQGKIAGLNSIGIKSAYKEEKPSSMLMVMDMNVFSIGDINSEGLEEILYNEGTYTKLFFKDSIIVGAVLINNINKSMAIKEAINNKRSFEKELENKENIYNLI